MIDLTQLSESVSIAVSGIVTTLITVVTTMIANWYRKELRERKIDKAVKDAVYAVEQRFGVKGTVHGEDKYRICVQYVNALLEDDGVSVPNELILETKIHAIILRMNNTIPKEGVKLNEI